MPGAAAAGGGAGEAEASGLQAEAATPQHKPAEAAAAAVGGLLSGQQGAADVKPGGGEQIRPPGEAARLKSRGLGSMLRGRLAERRGAEPPGPEKGADPCRVKPRTPPPPPP